jgi:tetratricopeptide (TPR) repeat protein
VRTFIAAETGRSQAIEVMTATGVFESDLRWWFRGTRADEARKRYAEYVEHGYDGTLDRVTPADAEDLTTPFEITVAVKDSRIVYTDPWQIEIYLRPANALERVPATLTASPGPPRTQDYAWPVPHVYEVENRIVVPRGFRLPAASDRVRSLGPATLTERRRVDGQTLIVTFRFETGKPRLTAGELTALQDALRSVRDEEVHVTVEQTAFELAHAGKLREAIAECERLIALDPRQAAHQVQLAMVLLGAGAGEAARRAARKAVELGPSEPESQKVLGWTLSHDTLGRPFTYDWDRAGAIAAYRKARALDPGHRGILGGLSDALARDRFGRPFELGSDLPAAIEAMRAAYAIRKSDDRAIGLASLLVWTGQHAEGEQIARTAAQSDTRDRLIVLAVAAASGARAAIQVAGELRNGPSRTQLIEQAAWWVLFTQRYDVAREMFAETRTTAPSTAFAAMLDRLAAGAAIKPGTSDPRSAVIEVLEALVDGQRKTAVFWDAPFERGARAFLARLVPAQVPGGGQLRYRDDVVRSATIQLDGESGAWRASVEVMGKRGQLYFALDRGVVKLVGSAELPAAVGRYALASLGEAGGETRARRLLDWLRADVDQASGTAPTFKLVWGSGLPSSHDAIALAAAVLASTTDPDRAMAVRCPSTLPAVQFACHEVLMEGSVVRERWADALAHIEAMVRLRPDQTASLARRQAWLLARLGRLDAADKLIDDVVAKDAPSRDVLAVRMDAAEAAGQTQQVLLRAEALAKHPNATPTDLNSIAWTRLGANDDLPVALELARKAAQATPNSRAIVNTLAAIEAELGDLDRAVHDNWKSMELSGLVEPGAPDWYVAGRIYEQLGLTADAIAAYKRIAKSIGVGVTSYSLAQNRLAAMRQRH